MDEVEIPHYIDAQPQILFWELDECAPVIALLGIGVGTDTLSLCFPFMIAFSYLFKHFKASQMEGILMHLVYWYGILGLNKMFRNGMSREFVS